MNVLLLWLVSLVAFFPATGLAALTWGEHIRKAICRWRCAPPPAFELFKAPALAPSIGNEHRDHPDVE